MWDFSSRISEARNVLSGRTVCKVDALLLCRIWVLLSMKHHLHQVPRWSAQ